jgi:hypothetical protein
VLTAAASLEAVRAALREPRRTLTELGDGGSQGEQILTAVGAPGAPDGCHRLSNRPGDHELEFRAALSRRKITRRQVLQHFAKLCRHPLGRQASSLIQQLGS